MTWEDDFNNEFRRMRMRLGRLFDSNLDRENRIEREYRRPWADLSEREDEYELNIELPGINKGDIHIDINNNNLIIKAEKRQEKKQKDENGHRYAKEYAGFYRSITLPEDADKEVIDASFNNGILNIIIPKLKNHKKGKINVK